jgi:hypothetical protein
VPQDGLAEKFEGLKFLAIKSAVADDEKFFACSLECCEGLTDVLGDLPFQLIVVNALVIVKRFHSLLELEPRENEVLDTMVSKTNPVYSGCRCSI